MSALEFNQRLMSMRDLLLYFAMSLTRNMDDAKDLLQESFLKALTHREQYLDGSNFKAWMHTIVRNTFINEHRRNKRGARILERVAREELPVVNGRYLEGPVAALHTKEILGRMRDLPESIGKPFQMNMEGFKYQEIADAMDLPIGTVKSRIFQARRKLMAELEHRTATR